MNARDLVNLVVLAALWGASFLLMRISVPEFGPVPLIGLRVVIAALVLSPFLYAGKARTKLIDHWKPILALGLVQSALPFCLLAYATLHLGAGFAAIANASSPLFAALIALAWSEESINFRRALGLISGFVGVVILLAEKVSPDVDASFTAASAAVTAAACYGVAAVLGRKKLGGIAPISVAAGSQLAAAAFLLPPALWFWPQEPASAEAWVAVAALGIACTGYAFTVYNRLIARAGPTNAISVTYLVPVFAVFWGSVFLDEALTRSMAAGGVVILTGTALATNFNPRSIPAEDVSRQVWRGFRRNA